MSNYSTKVQHSEQIRKWIRMWRWVGRSGLSQYALQVKFPEYNKVALFVRNFWLFQRYWAKIDIDNLEFSAHLCTIVHTIIEYSNYFFQITPSTIIANGSTNDININSTKVFVLRNIWIEDCLNNITNFLD